MKKLVFGLLLYILALDANAGWKQFGYTKIYSLVEWEGNGPVFVEVAPQTYCYVPPDEKAMIALLTSLYVSGRTAYFHCYDTPDTINAMSGYRLHRINTG